MSCCGGRRGEWIPPSFPVTSATDAAPAESPRTVEAESILFEYTGQRGLRVRGTITGRSYRFDSPGAQVAVNRRDAPRDAGDTSLAHGQIGNARIAEPMDQEPALADQSDLPSSYPGTLVLDAN